MDIPNTRQILVLLAELVNTLPPFLPGPLKGSQCPWGVCKRDLCPIKDNPAGQCYMMYHYGFLPRFEHMCNVLTILSLSLSICVVLRIGLCEEPIYDKVGPGLDLHSSISFL